MIKTMWGKFCYPGVGFVSKCLISKLPVYLSVFFIIPECVESFLYINIFAKQVKIVKVFKINSPVSVPFMLQLRMDEIVD